MMKNIMKYIIYSYIACGSSQLDPVIFACSDVHCLLNLDFRSLRVRLSSWYEIVDFKSNNFNKHNFNKHNFKILLQFANEKMLSIFIGFY